jgi:homoserine acetyltransferase
VGMVMLARPMARGGDLGTVEDQSFLIKNFRLQNGTVMPQVKIAYETYGALAAGGRNAVLITHGYTAAIMLRGATRRMAINRVGGTG